MASSQSSNKKEIEMSVFHKCLIASCLCRKVVATLFIQADEWAEALLEIEAGQLSTGR
jgi:hypothetical protein